MADEPDAKRARDTKSSEVANVWDLYDVPPLRLWGDEKALLAHLRSMEVENPDIYPAMKARFNELNRVHLISGDADEQIPEDVDDDFHELDFMVYIQRCLLHGPDMIEV